MALLLPLFSRHIRSLSELSSYKKGFDVILTCTGANHNVVSLETYESLLNGDTGLKTLIDIAIPQDISPQIVQKHKVHYLSIDLLQKISNANLEVRANEVDCVKAIVDQALEDFIQLVEERNVELVMQGVAAITRAVQKLYQRLS